MSGVASCISNGDRQCMGMGTGTACINRMVIIRTTSSVADTGLFSGCNFVICRYRVCMISSCVCRATSIV